MEIMTSESVNEGHPDKLCDQISDAILDACLEQDQDSKVAFEACTKTNGTMVYGEITTKAKVDCEKIVRDTCRTIGFVSDVVGLDADNCKVLVYIEQQSPDIAHGVLPTKLGARLREIQIIGFCSWLSPDGKTQVTVEYGINNGAVVSIRVRFVNPSGRFVIGGPHGDKIVKENFDFRPGIISINLDLKRGGNGRFLKTAAAYGHFGRDD